MSYAHNTSMEIKRFFSKKPFEFIRVTSTGSLYILLRTDQTSNEHTQNPLKRDLQQQKRLAPTRHFDFTDLVLSILRMALLLNKKSMIIPNHSRAGKLRNRSLSPKAKARLPLQATAVRFLAVYLLLSITVFLYNQQSFSVWPEENNAFPNLPLSFFVDRETATTGIDWFSPSKIQHQASALNALLNQSPKTYRTLSFVFEAPMSIDSEDITLATHISTNKLDVFLKQLKQWNGPASCAVYIKNQDDIMQLTDFVASNKDYLKLTSIHAMIESSTAGRDYPMSHLRNLALDNIQSDYFLAIDADFITDDTAYGELQQELKKKQKFYKDLRNKTLYVLPAFEHFMPSELEKMYNITVLTESPLPTTRPQLMQMVAANKTAPFHQYFRKGHGPTNYQKWYDDDERFSYPINYELRFEPYVVGYKHGVAKYWPGFRGFGYNKYTWFFELHNMGYKFRVVRHHFTIHKNHPSGGSGRKIRNTTRLEFLGFKRYMIEQYGVAPKELRDYADHFGDRQWHKFMDFNGREVLSEKAAKVGVWRRISNLDWENKNPGWELLTNGTHYGKAQAATKFS